jgi:YesN/AraC family two-component response regulator
MVSASCITIVKEALETLEIQVIVKLGEATTNDNVTATQLDQIRLTLLQSGFELLEDKKNILVEQAKTSIIHLVYHSDEPLVQNLSVYLSHKLGYDYTYISNLFSEKAGTTIEKFFICHKIERVKELLTYAELSLTEIAFKMHYSSVAHLSNQFKKITGLTPSQFKKGEGNKRDPLEDVCP